MEAYYNYPASKFYWPEFKNKVLVKNDGDELKRRMIIYNIRAMTNSQYNELVEITNIHNKIVRENFGT